LWTLPANLGLGKPLFLRDTVCLIPFRADGASAPSHGTASSRPGGETPAELRMRQGTRAYGRLDPATFVCICRSCAQLGTSGVQTQKTPSHESTIDHIRVHIVSSFVFDPACRRLSASSERLRCHHPHLRQARDTNPLAPSPPSSGCQLAADFHPAARIRSAQSRTIISRVPIAQSRALQQGYH
jgi:hypothetical protein